MQISAQNVFAAQASRAPKPASVPFEPPELKNPEKPVATEAAGAAKPAGYVRPGTHIDIKI